MTEFWRRWHMTLSTWLRDYLYIPLGGNRYGAVRLPQPDDNDAARRTMARRRLELRGLGRAARNWAVCQQAVARGGAAPPDADRRARRLAYRGARPDPALGHARLGVLRCDSAAQATEVLAAILGLRPHPGAAVLPVEGCILAIIGIDHTLGSARLRLSLSPRWARTLAWSGPERCSPSDSRRCRSYRNRSSTSSSEAFTRPPPR